MKQYNRKIYFPENIEVKEFKNLINMILCKNYISRLQIFSLIKSNS